MRTSTRLASRLHRSAAAGLAPVAVVALLASLLLAACAGSASAPDGEGANPGIPSSVDGGYDTGGKGQLSPVPAAPTEGATTDRFVVKTGTMTVEVEDLDESVDAARVAISGVGGYVSGTQAADYGEKRYAAITYRIPADRWDDALAALRKLGTKVTDEQTSAVEVTGTVLDLEARIRNLKATETALLTIMTKATKIADILSVQMQLSEVQGQIEQLTTEQAHLKDQAALGTLTVTFSVPVAAVTETTQGWDLAKEVDRALAALVGLGQGLVSFGIWLILVLVPLALVVALAIALVAALLRRLGLGVPAFRRSRTPLPPAPPAAPAA